MSLIAAIDIGTTGTRCMIFDLSGRCLGSAYEEYGLVHIKGGWIEQSVPDLLAATDRACRRAIGASGIDASKIESVGLSTQQVATCAFDQSGNLIRPMLSWQDTRATAEAGAIAAHFTMERFKSITGSPVTPNSVIAKMLWLRTHEPETFARTAKWLQPHHIALRHLGADDDFVDECEAGYYGLWDASTRSWHPELLQFAGVPSSAFGHVVAAGTKVGQISAAASERSGLPRGASLCVGAGDSACSLVGMGATSPGMASITLGTAGAAALTIDAPRTELAEFVVFGHPLPAAWSATGFSLAAASAYRWFRDVFGQAEQDAAQKDGSNVFEKLNALCESAPPGSDGLIFLPYLNSAGTPHWNPQARAAFLGIAQNHGRHHFARAVMEGVALEIQDMLKRFEQYGLKIDSIRVGGGAARSALWTQIQANIYNRPVTRLKEGETTALGAAVLAGVGAGMFSNIAEGARAMVGVHDTIEPQAEQTARYADLHAAYEDAYRSLAPSTFSRLSALQQ